jgi:hypothetical protein
MPSKDKKIGKAWREKNKEYLTAYRRLWKLKEYGMSEKELVSLYETQKGVCSICSKPLALYKDSTLETANVDHDHFTGKVRGLLCIGCNRGIGFLQDSSKIAERAAEYLEKYGR